MKNNKGFTLLELIVAVAILGILAMVTVPVLTQYIGKAQKGVCEANRDEFMHSYLTFEATDENGLTLQQAINGDIPELAVDAANLKCPSGGVYSVDEGDIHCSIHDGDGGSGEDDGVPDAGETIFESVVLQDWTAACNQSLNAGVYESGTTLSVNKGQVYVYDGKSYLVLWSNPWLSKTEALNHMTNPAGVNFLQEFNPSVTISSSAYNSSTGWNPQLQHLDVLYENGAAYLYMGNTTQWEVLPQYGGWWIRIQ